MRAKVTVILLFAGFSMAAFGFSCFSNQLLLRSRLSVANEPAGVRSVVTHLRFGLILIF
jgi:hypothetical protein